MGECIPSALPSLGIAFTQKVCRVLNRSGGDRLRGQCLMFDLALTVATNFKFGDPASAFYVCITPNSARDGFGLYALLLEDVADGREGLGLLWGNAPGRYAVAQEPIAFGSSLGPNGSSVALDGLGFAAAAKCCGFAFGIAPPPPSGLLELYWNGVYGIGKG
jgi:hypothetical protein